MVPNLSNLVLFGYMSPNRLLTLYLLLICVSFDKVFGVMYTTYVFAVSHYI